MIAMQVYILHFSDSTHYTGITTRSVLERLAEHSTNHRGRVWQKRSKGIGYVVGAIYQTDNPSDEHFYKRNVKRYCEVCIGEKDA